MYTFNRVIKDEKDVSKRRRVVIVEFIDGEKTLERDMQFSISEDTTVIKKAFKSFLDELNTPEPADVTDLSYTEPAPEEPTIAELAKTAWEADKSKLSQMQELIDMGVFDGTETPIVNLRAKVKDDFEPAFLN
jgi:hypothetical protein